MTCLHVVLFQNMPGVWTARGLEHDMMSEARTIGQALRAMISLVDAHSAYDRRHRRAPLSAFGAAPQSCWNAFTSGTPVTLSQLGIDNPAGCQIVAAIARRQARPIPQPAVGSTHASA